MGTCCTKPTTQRKLMSVAPQFRVIDGRRYHNRTNSDYFIPDDSEEAQRLEDGHYVVKYWWKRNFYSPVEESLKRGNAKVLDVGCGPGTWILEMARSYPRTKFVGVDISPIFPTEALPPNVEFLEVNLLDGLPYPNDYFDLIHQRFLVGAFKQVQWENNVIPELLRLCSPGGWIEFLEADSSYLSKGEATRRISAAAENFMRSLGMNPFIGKDLPELLRRTGRFSEVRTESKDIPLGSPGGDWGELALKTVARGATATRSILSAKMQITPEHYDALVEGFMIESETKRTLWVHHRVCGQKKPPD